MNVEPFLKNNNGHQNSKIMKELIKIFQTHGLKLEIKRNFKKVDYLDIIFDPNTGSYRPYRKRTNDTRYINPKSNHPPSILKQIPATISKRISTNSSNKEIFQNLATYYNNVFKNSGYEEKIQFQQYEHQQTQQGEIDLGTLYGLIHHSAVMSKRT